MYLRIRKTNLMLNKSLMQMLPRIIRPPPPIPCMTRAAMSILTLIDSPAIKDPIKKTKFANRRIGFLPNISLNLPHVGVAAAAANKKADPIHV